MGATLSPFIPIPRRARSTLLFHLLPRSYVHDKKKPFNL